MGLGEPSGKLEYHISEDINLEGLKSHAKSLGIPIGELFCCAAVVAHSKLDLPDERKPDMFSTQQAVSCHNAPSDSEHFQLKNDVLGVSAVLKRATSLEDASKDVKDVWKTYKERPDLVQGIFKFVRILPVIVPYNAFQKMMKESKTKLNLAMSNMTCCLKKPWNLQGGQVDWVTILACSHSLPKISLVTHNQTVKLAISADTGVFPESKQLLDGIVAELLSHKK